ncbi:PrP8 U5-snRNA-binding domain-containing protein, partial [Hamiltosporidium magnivora]
CINSECINNLSRDESINNLSTDKCINSECINNLSRDESINNLSTDKCINSECINTNDNTNNNTTNTNTNTNNTNNNNNTTNNYILVTSTVSNLYKNIDLTLLYKLLLLIIDETLCDYIISRLRCTLIYKDIKVGVNYGVIKGIPFSCYICCYYSVIVDIMLIGIEGVNSMCKDRGVSNRGSVVGGVSNRECMLEGVSNTSGLEGVGNTSGLEGVNNRECMLEGVNSMCKDRGVSNTSGVEGVGKRDSKLEGVGRRDSKLEGVSNTSGLEGVSNRDINEGVSNTLDKQQGVSNNTNSYHPLYNNTNSYHPLNNSTTYNPLYNNTNSYHPLNNSTTYHPLNNYTNSYHPLSTTNNNTNNNTIAHYLRYLDTSYILLRLSDNNIIDLLSNLKIRRRIFKNKYNKEYIIKDKILTALYMEYSSRVLSSVCSIKSKDFSVSKGESLYFSMGGFNCKIVRGDSNKDMLEGDNDKGSRLGNIKGVSNKSKGLEGVSNMSIRVEEVSNTTSNQHPLNTNTYNQHPLNPNNINTYNQHPVNTNTYNQHPLNPNNINPNNPLNPNNPNNINNNTVILPSGNTLVLTVSTSSINLLKLQVNRLCIRSIGSTFIKTISKWNKILISFLCYYREAVTCIDIINKLENKIKSVIKKGINSKMPNRFPPVIFYSPLYCGGLNMYSCSGCGVNILKYINSWNKEIKEGEEAYKEMEGIISRSVKGYNDIGYVGGYSKREIVGGYNEREMVGGVS